MLWIGQYAPTSTRSWSARHASPEYTQPTRTDQLVASARPGHRHSSALDWLRFHVVSGRLLYWAVRLSQRCCCRLVLCAGKGDAVARMPTLVPLIKSEGVVAPQPVDLRTVHAQGLRRARGQLSRVNYICRLASISFAGSPPRPGPAVGPHRCGSWGRQTPG